MDKKKLRTGVCEGYCSFYRPGKDEELACMGFTVIERLADRGKKVLFGNNGALIDAAVEEALVLEMCRACPFYQEDCDFVLKKKHSPPCGGFVLIGHLLSAKIISIDDIRNII